MGGGFFAIFVPPDPLTQPPSRAEPIKTSTGYEMPLASAIDQSYAQRTTIAMIANLFRLEAESDGQVKVVRMVDELTTCLHEGVLAAILHFEGAEAIDPGLDALEVFYQAGLRSLGIVWSRLNAFAHGVPFKFPHSPDTGPGLTDAGQELVRACNRLGIMLDLSHLNEQGFWDVAALSDAPLVATHSNAHTLCPDYLVEHLGIDCVGLGTDFDGATIPQEIGDVTGMPKLIKALREGGYDEVALRKLAYENWVRVLKKTWK